uniref:Uncharacterized protein n=1 Tax=Glossina austeni TaxID=7395 RepID=A0A1A9VYW9_GLOAU
MLLLVAVIRVDLAETSPHNCLRKDKEKKQLSFKHMQVQAPASILLRYFIEFSSAVRLLFLFQTACHKLVYYYTFSLWFHCINNNWILCQANMSLKGITCTKLVVVLLFCYFGSASLMFFSSPHRRLGYI